MNFQKTIVLAIFLSCVATYISLVELPREEEKANDELFLRGAKASSIRSIEVENSMKGYVLVNKKAAENAYIDPADKPQADTENEPAKIDKKDPSIRLASPGEGWELNNSPGAQSFATSKLDLGAVTSLISSLESINLGDALPKNEIEKDLSIYGLDKPELKVKVFTVASGMRELIFGRKSEYTQKRYVRASENENIYLVPDSIFLAANHNRDDFRDKTPIEIENEKIQRLILTNKNARTVIDKQPDSSWKITEPINWPASTDAVSELFRRLQALQVKSFFDDIDSSGAKLRELKLEKPDSTVQFFPKLAADNQAGTDSGNFSKNPLEIRLTLVEGGDPTMNILVAGPPSADLKQDKGAKSPNSIMPLVFNVAGNTISQYLLSADELREKMPFTFSESAVTEAVITQPGKKDLSLKQSKDGVWSIGAEEADKSQTGDTLFIESYIEKFSKLTAEAFPAEGEAVQIVDPVLGSKFTLNNGEIVSLSIGAPINRDNKSLRPALRRILNNDAKPDQQRSEKEKPLGIFISDQAFQALFPKVDTMVKVEPTPAVASAVPASTPNQ